MTPARARRTPLPATPAADANGTKRAQGGDWQTVVIDGQRYRLVPEAALAAEASSERGDVSGPSNRSPREPSHSEAQSPFASGGPGHSGRARRLTSREAQIAAMIARGLVNKQIASELNISEWTVSTHVRRMFAKLGVDTRAAMVRVCMEL